MLVEFFGLARFASRGEAVAVGSPKVMKKGVFSPSKGAKLPSVFSPKNFMSSTLGGAGEAEGAARRRRNRERIKAPADTGLTALLVGRVFEGSTAVPFSKVISILKFG